MTNTDGAQAAVSLPPIHFTSSIPEIARAGGRQGGENIFQQYMVDMPAPAPTSKAKGAPLQYAHFFVPVDEVAATITDPAEREKAAKAGTAKLVSRFTSISRRIRKDNSATHDYTFRKARDPADPETGTWGIIVYRIVPGTDKGGPGSAKSRAQRTTAGVGATAVEPQ